MVGRSLIGWCWSRVLFFRSWCWRRSPTESTRLSSCTAQNWSVGWTSCLDFSKNWKSSCCQFLWVNRSLVEWPLNTGIAGQASTGSQYWLLVQWAESRDVVHFGQDKSDKRAMHNFMLRCTKERCTFINFFYFINFAYFLQKISKILLYY